MKRIYWPAALLAGVVLAGAMVTAQETPSKVPTPQMHRMGQMMGMMGQGKHMEQMGEMGSMMQMMQGMRKMMDACAQMMGTTSSSSQEPKK